MNVRSEDRKQNVDRNLNTTLCQRFVSSLSTLTCGREPENRVGFDVEDHGDLVRLVAVRMFVFVVGRDEKFRSVR